jgi:hypothetical protein
MIINYRGFGADMPAITGPSLVEIDGRTQVNVTFPGAPNPYPLKLVYDPSITVPNIQQRGPMEDYSSRFLYLIPGQSPPDLIQLDAPFDDRYAPVPLPQFAPPVWIPSLPPQVRAIYTQGAAAPVPKATPIGETTVDLPGTGATKLPVFTAPIARPEIISDAQGRLVVVIPQDQPSNLPVTPIRTASGVVVDAGGLTQFSPEIWKMYFEIPKYRRDPAIDATELVDSTQRAATGAASGAVDANLFVVEGGVTDAEGRFYPTATAASASTDAQQTASGSAVLLAAGGSPDKDQQSSKWPWALAAVAAGYFIVRGRK